MPENLLDLFSIPPESILTSTFYDPWLVTLSIGIAIFASFMGFQVAEQAIKTQSNRRKQISISVGSIALGGGVWSMHFIGMLALDLCSIVSYDFGITAASVLLAIAASWVALSLAEKNIPDLILLDVMMPQMTGYQVCETLKADNSLKHIPVIFVTALDDQDDEAKGLNLGAVDYIAKPISAAVVRARVKTHLSLVQADELRRTRLQIIQRLGRAAEYKDNETGMHVMRMSHYSRIIAKGYGFSEIEAENLFNAAPMHDIGKIGIPDSIMLKPGKLTKEEFAVMQQHPEIGAEILGESDSDLIELAKVVSLTHHEKWDGSGYPKGLKGQNIPIEGRIVALADVFDALTSVRPYKDAWSLDKTMAFIDEQTGKHFDPEVVAVFKAKLDELLVVKERWKDE